MDQILWIIKNVYVISVYRLVTPVTSDRDLAERPLKVKPKAPPSFSKKNVNVELEGNIAPTPKEENAIIETTGIIGDPKTYFQALQREGMLLQAQGKIDQAVPILLKV